MARPRSIDAYGAHHGVPERSGLSAVEVDVDPDTGRDAVGAVAGLEVALLERGSELVALLAAESELGGAGGAEVTVRVARATKMASGRRA